jgi:hypothetical protein
MSFIETIKYTSNINYIGFLVLLIVMMLIIHIMNNVDLNKLDKNSIDNNDNNNDNKEHELIEGFKNNLKDLVDGGRRRRKERFNDKQAKRSEISKLFERFSKTEKYYDKNDRSIDHFKDKVSKYYRSFNKDKFTNVPKNSRISLEKFNFFKEAFWDIFKD